VRGIASVKQPLKVIVDSRLQLPDDARLLDDGSVLVVGAVEDAAARRRLEARGCEVLLLPNAAAKVDLPQLMLELARRQCNEVHVESGFKLNGSLLREGCVDELLMYFSASLLGEGARGMFSLPAITDLAQRTALEFHKVDRIGADLRVIARQPAPPAATVVQP
jgi:diaminohydroxyphosphoribosylaminopyrimidine deaminase/5-amino-6-(5-phosphoribosylamino)uracil reductase